jgi:hypothetical protein
VKTARAAAVPGRQAAEEDAGKRKTAELGRIERTPVVVSNYAADHDEHAHFVRLLDEAPKRLGPARQVLSVDGGK